MSDDNIITAKFGEPRAPLVKNYKRGHFHTHYEIDDDKVLTCRDCGKEVSATDVLWAMANRWGNMEYEMRRLRLTLADLRDEVDDLKRQRRNLRAQIKRAEKKRA